jgi:hypothetical protein
MQTGITDAPKLAPVSVVLAEITYVVTEADYAAWWAYHAARPAGAGKQNVAGPGSAESAKTIMWGLLVLLVLTILTVPSLLEWLWPGTAAEKLKVYALLVWGLVALVVMVIVLFFVVRWGTFYQLARTTPQGSTELPQRPDQFSAQQKAWFFRFVMTAESFTETATRCISQFGLEFVERKDVLGWWSSLEEIVVLDQQILFVMQRNQGAYIIPRRAFADEQAFHSFVETARKCLEKANTIPELPAVQSRSTAITDRP